MTAHWWIYGTAAIDGRPPVGARLQINTDGTWSARVDTFTLADTVDLMFRSAAGGDFCGPAFVEKSEAHTAPLRGSTALTGVGPLLVVDPTTVIPELPAAADLEGEVVG